MVAFFSGVTNSDSLNSKTIKFLNAYSNVLFKCNVKEPVKQSEKSGLIQLEPEVKETTIKAFDIDTSEAGTQLVRKIEFSPTTGIQGFNVQNRDLFTIK